MSNNNYYSNNHLTPSPCPRNTRSAIGIMHRQNCMNQPPTMNWYYNPHQTGAHHHQVPYHQGYCGAQGEQMWHHHFHTDLPQELYAGMSQVQVSGYATGGQGVETQLPSPPITVSGSEMSSPGGDASPPMMVNSNGRPTPARSPYEWIKRTNYTTGTSQELLWSGSGTGISSPSPSEESGETRRGNRNDGDGVRWRTSSVEEKTRTQSKRYRQVYSRTQRHLLEEAYQNSPTKYLTAKKKEELVSVVGLSARQIKTWFQNRRAKDSRYVRDVMASMKGSLMSNDAASSSSSSNTNTNTISSGPDASSDWNFFGKTRTKDKYRVVYTDHQRVELEKEFYYSRYITIRRKTELAATLGLSERQVKIWFQNRRAKERKQVKKREELTQRESLVGLGDHQHQLGPNQHQHQHHLGQDLLSPVSTVIM